MTFEEIFGEAKWIAPTDTEKCPIIKKEFEIKDFESVYIDILGFSAFNFYVNGQRGSEDYFLPLASDFEYRGSPVGEQTAHRCYVSHYDITEFIKNGENCLTVMLGDGWYTGHTGRYPEIPYGEKKLCFKITVKNKESEYCIFSDTDALWRDSYVKFCDLNYGEEHDYTDYSAEFLLGKGGADGWLHTKYAPAPDTEYYYTDCPPDRVVELIVPKKIGEIDGCIIYDAGRNITGFPSLVTEDFVGQIEVAYSEDIDENGDLLKRSMHEQRTNYKVSGGKMILEPAFTWLGFRYFKVRGKAVTKVPHPSLRPRLVFFIVSVSIDGRFCKRGKHDTCEYNSRCPCQVSYALLQLSLVLALDSASDLESCIEEHIDYGGRLSHKGGSELVKVILATHYTASGVNRVIDLCADYNLCKSLTDSLKEFLRSRSELLLGGNLLLDRLPYDAPT